MKNLLYLSATALLLVTSCKKDETKPNQQLSGTLRGANSNPANNSQATGAVTGTFNPNNNQMSYTVTYSGLQPTAGHFHIGAPGTDGPVTVDLGNVATSPVTGSVTLSQSQVDAMRVGNLYVNLHTAAFPNGEIRGVVTAQ